MTRLHIDLADEVIEQLREKAARWEYASVEEYVQAILVDEAEEYGTAMYHANWDRLLETCHKQGTDLLFVPGSPPLVRTASQWRTLSLPPLVLEEIRSLATEALKGAPHVETDGYSYCDFWYGDVEYFRAMAFGFPETTVFMVAKLPKLPPEKGLYIKTDWPVE